MRKLYEKKEILFTLCWILAYCAVTGSIKRTRSGICISFRCGFWRRETSGTGLVRHIREQRR